MPDISPQMVKELREKTGAGMMDCKKALDETKGGMEAAIDWLRKKGLSAAAKKAGRVAADGLIGVASSGKKASVVEINAETDFVARNEKFRAFVLEVAKIALDTGAEAEELKTKQHLDGVTVQDRLTHHIATIGENMTIRRAAHLQVPHGVVATYVHNALAPNVGKIGVLVALESSAEPSKLVELGKQLAMHIAATRPDVLTVESVDPKALERERAILTDQAKASGKHDNVIPKMVEGRLRKYYEDVVLLEQTWVIDGETLVKDVLEKAGKTLGAPVKVAGFVRYQLGEGIEKTTGDFAEDVAKMTG